MSVVQNLAVQSYRELAIARTDVLTWPAFARLDFGSNDPEVIVEGPGFSSLIRTRLLSLGRRHG